MLSMMPTTSMPQHICHWCETWAGVSAVIMLTPVKTGCRDEVSLRPGSRGSASSSVTQLAWRSSSSSCAQGSFAEPHKDRCATNMAI